MLIVEKVSAIFEMCDRKVSDTSVVALVFYAHTFENFANKMFPHVQRAMKLTVHWIGLFYPQV